MIAVVHTEPEARLDYAAAVDPSNLEPVDRLVSGAALRLLVAARFGTTRLLDNLSVVVP